MDFEYVLGYLSGRYDIDREFLLRLYNVAKSEGFSVYVIEDVAVGFLYKKKLGSFMIFAVEYEEVEDDEDDEEEDEGEEYDT